MRKAKVGGQELELLRYLAEHGPASVGETTDGFGKPYQLARSTVMTMMERLRKKGHLVREEQEGVYRYASAVGRDIMLRDLVRQFVEKTLAGSLSPFVAYLTEEKELSEAEFTELQTLVARLGTQREEETP